MKQSEFNLLASMISARTGVSCNPVWDGIWCADVKNKIIEYPIQMEYTESDMGLLIHEAAHLRFTTPFEREEFQERAHIAGLRVDVSQVFDLLNALEDTRIEKKILTIYPGAKYYLKVMQNETWEEGYYYRDDSRLWALYALYFCWHSINPDWAEEVLELRGHADNEKLRKAINATLDIAPTAKDMATTGDVLDLIGSDLIEHYLPLCDESLSEEEIKKLAKKLLELLKQLAKELKQKSENQEEATKKEEEKKRKKKKKQAKADKKK